MLKFPHSEVFIVLGPEGPRMLAVDFIEKGNKMAIEVLWKGEMVRDPSVYNRLGEARILEFLKFHGVDYNSITTQDFGKDKNASREAINNFLNEENQ